MAISSLAAGFKITANWSAGNSLTGSDYAQTQNATAITKTLSIGTTAANAAVGGGDELYSAVTSLAGGASASIDLTSVTDILATAATSFARVKAILIRVLSTTDDSVIGTAASGAMIDGTVANALLSASGSGWLKAATSTFDIPNGGFIAFGTPSATGVLVSGGAKVIKVTNNDGAVTAKVQITVIGGTT